MTRREVVEKLLKAMTNNQWNMSSSFGGAAGVSGGAAGVLQADMNRAIGQWFHGDDTEAIRGVTRTLYATGAINDQEFEELMRSIEQLSQS